MTNIKVLDDKTEILIRMQVELNEKILQLLKSMPFYICFERNIFSVQGEERSQNIPLRIELFLLNYLAANGT